MSSCTRPWCNGIVPHPFDQTMASDRRFICSLEDIASEILRGKSHESLGGGGGVLDSWEGWSHCCWGGDGWDAGGFWHGGGWGPGHDIGLLSWEWWKRFWQRIWESVAGCPRHGVLNRVVGQWHGGDDGSVLGSGSSGAPEPHDGQGDDNNNTDNSENLGSLHSCDARVIPLNIIFLRGSISQSAA